MLPVPAEWRAYQSEEQGGWVGGQFVAQAKLAKGSEYGLGMATSEDGVTNWTDVVRASYGPFDTQTTGMWDSQNEEYAIFTRGCTHDTQGKC